MPPLKRWQIIPVPPPTLPSGTGPPRAFAIAWRACAFVTWKPSMSLSDPSQVSATTGRAKRKSSHFLSTAQPMTASRTTPTLIVLVIMTGPQRNPDSSSQCVPVISPLPLSVLKAAKTGSGSSFPRGRTAVTPVRTGPLPRTSGPSPSMSVTCPTSTPATSVIASSVPAVPPIGMPRSRARSPGGGASESKSGERAGGERAGADHRRDISMGVGITLSHPA